MNQKWVQCVLSAEVEMDGAGAAVTRVLGEEHTATLSHDDLRLAGARAGLLTVARHVSGRRPR
jgi:hypothetical protein